MFTLLGSLLGFMGSLVPEIFKYVRDRSDQAHELEILDRQMQMMKLKHAQSLEELSMIGHTEVSKLLYKYPHRMGIRWVDGLSGSVRPLITYAFFLMYFVIKTVQVCAFWKVLSLSGWEGLLSHVWHEEDQVLFATVMSFWFGQRALIRRGKKE